MDKLIQAAADIDDLQYRIHCAIELVRDKDTDRTRTSPDWWNF